MGKAGKRNDLLDALKVFFVVGVALAHYRFPYPYGQLLGSFGALGVIVFFLIQGYQAHFDDPAEARQIWPRLRRNGLLFPYAMLPGHGQGIIWEKSFADWGGDHLGKVVRGLGGNAA